MTDQERMDAFFATTSYDAPPDWRDYPELGEGDDDEDEITTLGSATSGNYGHSGRLGYVGGSGPDSGTSNFTAAEQLAVDNYTQGYYVNINGKLRTGSDTTWVTDEKDPAAETAERIKQLDSLMAKSAFTKNTLLYRIVDPAVVGNLNVGDVLLDKGFVSTTNALGAKFEKGYPTEQLTSINYDITNLPIPMVQLRIDVPAGTHYINVNNTIGEGHMFASQHEVILDRGLKYVVTYKSADNKQMTLMVKQ